MRIAYKIHVIGRVQGVGFRPFIHRLAVECKVSGYVKNLGGGEVEVYVEGQRDNVHKFLERFQVEKPPPARIDEFYIVKVKPKGKRKFIIESSSQDVILRSEITPDLAVCKECLYEILNPNDRRYRYPFNSCAYCGPRYSYMESLPYDRENITMKDFPLCRDCLREYKDLWNIRRYDAKGISCSKCGPKLWLIKSNGETIETNDPIVETAKLIDEGAIVAIKGIGGFHIACLATNDDVVLKLRERKNRPQKPFALMALNLEIADKIVEIPESLKLVIESPEAPILILPRREGSEVSSYVAPGLKSLGVMIAYTPLHYLLLMEVKDKYLIMTSGNPPGKPMVITNEDAIKELSNIVDYLLVHNRRIVNRVDDSVLRVTDGNLTFLRRGRGYAPESIRLPFKLPFTTIALGAELQNTGALAFDDKAILTQYIGDTDTVECLEDLKRYITRLSRMLKINIEDSKIVTDMHPRYLTTKLGEELVGEKDKDRLLKVQHHYAHFASALADWKHNPQDQAVGIAIDGAGYGTDGNVWGGEVLVYTDGVISRVGHLEYHPMPGGDRATTYPARMLASILWDLNYTLDEVIELFKAKGIIRQLPLGELEIKVAYNQWVKRDILTSSCGRFLDSISSLLKICGYRSYEGEPAIKLEENSIGGTLIIKPSHLELVNSNRAIITSNILEHIIDYLDKVSIKDIGYTVQYIIGWAFGELAYDVSLEYNVKNVYISGGAAVNSIIYRGIRDRLGVEGLNIKIPRRIPPGDGGISLGQIYIVGVLNYYEKV